MHFKGLSVSILRMKINLCVIIMATAIVVVSGGKYLTERPDILKPCKQTEANFKACFIRNFQVIFTEWKDGIPGLPSLGPFDPLKVKRVVIAEDGNGPVSVNMVFTNMVLTGLTGAVLDDVNLNPTKSVMKLQIKLPKVNVKSEYDVKGRVLSLPLIGSGKALVDIGNLKAELALRYKLREEGGLTFADIEKIRVDFKDAAEFRLTLDNPQSEQTVLEEATNSAVNENWREYFEVMRPSITETVESIMGDRLQKMFSYIPATYFIEDIGVST